MRARSLGFCSAVVCATFATPLAAAVSMQASVSARQVEVGQPFQFRLTALSDRSDETPGSPTLVAPPGVRVSQPSVGSQTQVTITNGQMQQRLGFNANWQLTATRAGQFRIGPASVEVGGKRVQSEAIMVEVVPAGKLPQRPQAGMPFDPFDMFDPRRRGRPFPGFPFDLDEPEEDPDQIQFPPEFKVDKAPDPVAFLRATITPENAVVGEQVTLRVYAYGNRGPFNQSPLSTEPSRDDFIGYQIGDMLDQTRHRVPIGDEVWIAAEVREFALFPIRAGTLTAGKMKFGFDGRGYASQGAFQGLVRICDGATVNVSEPPLKNRPAGYKLGDVGDYQLTVKVEPRELSQGESVSVIAKLEGVGNVPSKLRLPERHGLVWGEPSVIEKVEPNGDFIQGYRVFTYVLRVDESGSVDLGEITLPHWNPRQRAYGVARARLDKVEVKPNPRAVAKKELKKDTDPLKEVVTLRKELGSTTSASTQLADRPWYWALLLGGPLGVVLTGAGVRLGAKLRERARAKKQAHERLAKDALRDAASSLERSDHAATASAIERAIFTAIEGASGLKARAVLKSELAEALTRNGFASELADQTQKLLEGCDALRFTGETEAGGTSALLAQAREVAQKLREAGRRIKVAD